MEKNTSSIGFPNNSCDASRKITYFLDKYGWNGIALKCAQRPLPPPTHPRQPPPSLETRNPRHAHNLEHLALRISSRITRTKTLKSPREARRQHVAVLNLKKIISGISHLSGREASDFISGDQQSRHPTEKKKRPPAFLITTKYVKFSASAVRISRCW